MSEAHAYSHPATALAPWGEIMLDTGPRTVDDLLTMPDDGWR